MKKGQIFNLVTFGVLIFISASLVYVLGTMNFSSPFNKPWHLLPSVHEDSLSSVYKDRYQILGSKSLCTQFFDSSRTNVFILVDSWGVPIREGQLQDDFKIFDAAPHRFALHRRLANNTRHAEYVEFRNDLDRSIFLFGGDSLQFNRTEYIPSLGFHESVFCSNCGTDSLAKILDSLLCENAPQLIAWTAIASQNGNQDLVRQVLENIATLAQKHPRTRFVVQGTHRPMLCDYKIKGLYKSHWVPVAVLN